MEIIALVVVLVILIGAIAYLLRSKQTTRLDRQQRAIDELWREKGWRTKR